MLLPCIFLVEVRPESLPLHRAQYKFLRTLPSGETGMYACIGHMEPVEFLAHPGLFARSFDESAFAKSRRSQARAKEGISDPHQT